MNDLQARVRAIAGFPLGADITLTEFRDEGLVDARLAEFHRLQVRRRNSVVGVLIDADEWRAVVHYITGLERELETLEDQRARALIEGREAQANPVQATDETIAQIDHMYHSLIARE